MNMHDHDNLSKRYQLIEALKRNAFQRNQDCQQFSWNVDSHELSKKFIISFPLSNA